MAFKAFKTNLLNVNIGKSTRYKPHRAHFVNMVKLERSTALGLNEKGRPSLRECLFTFLSEAMQ